MQEAWDMTALLQGYPKRTMIRNACSILNYLIICALSTFYCISFYSNQQLAVLCCWGFTSSFVISCAIFLLMPVNATTKKIYIYIQREREASWGPSSWCTPSKIHQLWLQHFLSMCTAAVLCKQHMHVPYRTMVCKAVQEKEQETSV